MKFLVYLLHLIKKRQPVIDEDEIEGIFTFYTRLPSIKLNFSLLTQLEEEMLEVMGLGKIEKDGWKNIIDNVDYLWQLWDQEEKLKNYLPIYAVSYSTKQGLEKRITTQGLHLLYDKLNKISNSQILEIIISMSIKDNRIYIKFRNDFLSPSSMVMESKDRKWIFDVKERLMSVLSRNKTINWMFCNPIFILGITMIFIISIISIIINIGKETLKANIFLFLIGIFIGGSCIPFIFQSLISNFFPYTIFELKDEKQLK